MKILLSKFWVIMICLTSLAARDSHKESPCCLILRSGQCKTSCESIPASKYVSNLTRKSTVTEDLESVCSNEKHGFWNCINRHLRGGLWVGSTCCHRGHGWSCQAACVNATSQADLQRSCRKSDEVELYNCLEQKMKSDHCCRKAKGNRDCTAACRDAVYAEHVGVSEAVVSKVMTSCARSPEALDCVSRQLGLEQGDNPVSPRKGGLSGPPEARLVCCDESSSPVCQEGCRSTLRSGSEEHEIMNELEVVCGEPNLTDRFWQCILRSSSSNKTRSENKRKQQTRSPAGQKKFLGTSKESKQRPVGTVDLLKLPDQYTEIQAFEDYDYFDTFPSHGHKETANSAPKKKLDDFRHRKLANDLLKLQCCNRAYSDECRQLCQDVYLDDYSRIIEFEKKCQLTQPSSELQDCLLEVDEPCQPGCDGLSFCSIFNRSPTETFRSCTLASDHTAQIDYASWVSGKSSITFLQHRLSLNVTGCHPEMWQAFSCYHHIKPCGGRRGRTSATPKICMKDCYDLLHKCLEGADGAEIANYMCSIFASGDSDCISLTKYLHLDQKKIESRDQVTAPCANSNSCSDDEICVPEPSSLEGISHTCRPGCRLGDSSTQSVPVGTWITAPCGEDGCTKICRCGEKGQFAECRNLSAQKPKNCIVGNREVEHAAQFTYDCNVCGCNAGELTCTKRKCASTSRRHETLPCKCPESFEPVCGQNGKTYPNHCVASRCNMQTDVKPGSCRQAADGQAIGCPPAQVSVPANYVCLAHRKWQDSLPCEQSICVTTGHGNCNYGYLGSVCDVYGRTHFTICELVKSKVLLSHWGSCQLNCSLMQTCGIDGQTYETECVSKAKHVPVDYYGECAHVGGACSRVQCPRTPPLCRLVTPPGACCPKCLNFIRLVLSNKQLYKLVMSSESHTIVSVNYMLSVLRTLISVSECRLGGYLHYEGDMILYTYSEESSYEICKTELEGIYEAFVTRSPRIHIDPVLSAVVAVDWSGTQNSGVSSSSYLNKSVLTFGILHIFTIFIVVKAG